MNDQFSLNVKTPCTENYNRFSPTQQGGFCDSCEKEVIDFSTMNSQEIINHFKINKSQNTCGRFKNDQLKTYNHTLQKRKRIRFISGFGIILIAFFSFNNAHAQDIKNQTKKTSTFQNATNEKNITVKGTVTDGEVPLPGVNIILEGTTVGVSTDFDGYFEFPQKLKKGDVLVISYIGMSSKKVVIQNKNFDLNNTLQINLEMDSGILMGKVAVKEVYSSKKS